jgi:hypothetical protein
MTWKTILIGALINIITCNSISCKAFWAGTLITSSGIGAVGMHTTVIRVGYDTFIDIGASEAIPIKTRKTLAIVTSIGVSASSIYMTRVISGGTLIDIFTVCSIASVAIITFTVIASISVQTGSISVTVSGSDFTQVDSCAVYSISNVSVHTSAVVWAISVGTSGIRMAVCSSLHTFIDVIASVFVRVQSVSIIADTLVATKSVRAILRAVVSVLSTFINIEAFNHSQPKVVTRCKANFIMRTAIEQRLVHLITVQRTEKQRSWAGCYISPLEFGSPISAKAYKLITKYFSICAVKEVIIANRAPGIIDTDLDSSLSRILIDIVWEVYESDISGYTISKLSGLILAPNSSGLSRVTSINFFVTICDMTTLQKASFITHALYHANQHWYWCITVQTSYDSYCTIAGESKLRADNRGILVAPQFTTHCPETASTADLHSSSSYFIIHQFTGQWVSLVQWQSDRAVLTHSVTPDPSILRMVGGAVPGPTVECGTVQKSCLCTGTCEVPL